VAERIGENRQHPMPGWDMSVADGVDEACADIPPTLTPISAKSRRAIASFFMCGTSGVRRPSADCPKSTHRVQESQRWRRTFSPPTLTNSEPAPGARLLRASLPGPIFTHPCALAPGSSGLTPALTVVARWAPWLVVSKSARGESPSCAICVRSQAVQEPGGRSARVIARMPGLIGRRTASTGSTRKQGPDFVQTCAGRPPAAALEACLLVSDLELRPQGEHFSRCSGGKPRDTVRHWPISTLRSAREQLGKVVGL
jgi:hypothetical protein